jgi:two-component system sensor histidine kinase UhpB
MALENLSRPAAFVSSDPRLAGAARLISLTWWRRWSLRRQILVVLIAIMVAAAVAALGLTVLNAKRAVELEVSSAVAGVERMVREIVGQPGNLTSGLERLRNLPTTAGAFRHVTVTVIGANDGRAALLPVPQSFSATAAPAWFASLLGVPDVRREVQVIADGRHIGSVVIVGNSADEITEVWLDLRDLALLAVGLSVAVIVLFWLALGRVLKPLAGLTSGLGQLEIGNYSQRLARPSVKEFGKIIDSFNALATRLAVSKKRNETLSQKLVSTQDEERRLIATELHDEWGPCLFGIKANVASLDRLAKELPAKRGAVVRERLQVIDEIADRIQRMNRALLNKLSAVGTSHVSLPDMVSSLVSDFRKHAPSTQFSLTLSRLDQNYDDATKTTIRRCLQESLTNALRHGQAKAVDIKLTTGDDCEDCLPAYLALHVQDDGRGIPADMRFGLGLTGMTERVNALGGTIEVSSGSDGGTAVSISLPFTPLSDARSPKAKVSSA